MDILAEVLDRVRLGGTLLFHFELGHPWSLALPERPYALFHYLSRGSATLALEQGRELRMAEGDFVVVTRGEPHVIYSDRRTKPFSVLDLARPPAHLGVVRHGLVVSGSHDTMLPANNAYAMFKALSNAQLVLYPDSGHGALFQYHELFVSHVRTFLEA